MSDGSNPHIRNNRSILAALERRALIWMARRLPEAIKPDHLSALSLFSAACTGLAFAAFQWDGRAAAAGLVAALFANWFGDSLDGTVARVRGIERPRYGYYVDHVIDLTGSAFIFTGIAYSGLMTPLLAVILLAAYLLVSAETYLATHATSVFRMSFFGIGPTELRLLLAAGAIKAAGDPSVAIGGLGSVKLFDVGGIIAIGGLAAAFVVSAIGNARVLYLAEPLERQDDRESRTSSRGIDADPGGQGNPDYERSNSSGPPTPNRCTEIPAASNPLRSVDASRPAPGVSPCTQTVSAVIGTGVPSFAITTLSTIIRTARETTSEASLMTDSGRLRGARVPSLRYARSANASAATRRPADRPAASSAEPGSPNRINDGSNARTARAIASAILSSAAAML